MVLIGIPEPLPLAAGSLGMQRRKLAGSLIGGIREIQEKLDFCVHQIELERQKRNFEVGPVMRMLWWFCTHCFGARGVTDSFRVIH